MRHLLVDYLSNGSLFQSFSSSHQGLPTHDEKCIVAKYRVRKLRNNIHWLDRRYREYATVQSNLIYTAMMINVSGLLIHSHVRYEMIKAYSVYSLDIARSAGKMGKLQWQNYIITYEDVSVR